MKTIKFKLNHKKLEWVNTHKSEVVFALCDRGMDQLWKLNKKKSLTLVITSVKPKDMTCVWEVRTNYCGDVLLHALRIDDNVIYTPVEFDFAIEGFTKNNNLDEPVYVWVEQPE